MYWLYTMYNDYVYIAIALWIVPDFRFHVLRMCMRACEASKFCQGSTLETWGYMRIQWCISMILYCFGWMDCWIPPSWFLRHRWCLFHIVCVMLSRCQGLTSKPIETQVAMLPMEGNGMEKLCRDLESWAQRATRREMETALYGTMDNFLNFALSGSQIPN